MACLMLLATLVLATQSVSASGPWKVGVCYGGNGDNLPSPADMVSLYKRINVRFVRIYEPFTDVLDALRGSALLVAVGPTNDDIKNMATQSPAASTWVNTFIKPYINEVSFKWITIGNEVVPGEYSPYVATAMRNVNAALQDAGISDIYVTTILSGGALANSYPPSAGEFTPEITEIITDIVSFLSFAGSPLMINAYPYFAYAADPNHISLEYATFRSETPVVIDGDVKYFNLFEAMVDSFNVALEKINRREVRVAVAETGWPTRGNPPYASVDNAFAYNKGLLNYVTTRSTPRRPYIPVEAFLFEIFTEDLKQGEVEQSFGLFTPDMAPVYNLWN